jgi:hypothetical protein
MTSGSAARSGPRRDNLEVLWAAVAILLPALLVSVASISAIDLAYGIRAGALVLDGAGVPRTDTFTFTAAGLPWVDQQWLGQAVLAAVYRAGGWPALAAAWAVVVASIQVLLWTAARAMGAGPPAAATGILLGFVVAAQGIGLRAQVLGLLCLAALLAVVARRHRHPRALWLAVPILAAWANLHGSFPIGLALLALTAAEDAAAHRRVRVPVAVAAVAGAATLLNPFGVDAWRYVATIGADPTIARFVVEWQHTSPLDPAGAAFYASVVAVAVLAAVSARRGRRPTAWTLAWLGGLALLGAWAVRAIAWWGTGAAPLAAAMLTAVAASRTGRTDIERRPTPAGEGSRGTSPAPVALAASAVLLLVVVAIQPAWHPAPDGGGIGARLRDAPAGVTGAVRDAAADHPDIRVFNAQRWGSWLELMVPGAALFADSRIELIPGEAWSDYVAVSEAAAGWQDILDTWQVDLVVASGEDQPALVTAVRGDPGWRVVYDGSDGIVAARSAPRPSG